MATNRANYMGLWFMPETTPGVDPGITLAPIVNGASETYKFQPDSTYRAWARMSEKISGLPKRPLVEIPQVQSRRDFAKCRVKGIEDVGEITIPFVLNGGIQDYDTTGDTGRTQPPPWLRLMGSALAKELGRLAAAAGGPDTTVDGVGLSPQAFSVLAGLIQPGHVLAVEDPGSSEYLEIIRPTSGSTVDVTAADYHGVAFGFTDTPAGGENVFFATQVAPDKQFEAVSETFTLLLQRDNSEASIIFKGARCNAFEISSKVGEVPTVKLTFTYKKFDYVDDALEQEPAYYATYYPCAGVTANARVCLTWDQNADGIVDPSDIKRDLDVDSIMIKYTSGYVRRKSSTTLDGSGIAEIFASQESKWEVEFTCIYEQEFQELVGKCCSAPFGHLTLYYWEIFEDFVRTSDSALRQGAWFAAFPSLTLVEDPGSDGETDSIMTQTIKFEAGDWQGDNGAFDVAKHVDTLGVVGIV